MRALKIPKDAWFGGDMLRAADRRISITNFAQEITEKTDRESRSAGLDGRRRGRHSREMIRVTVRFRVLETRDPEAREMAVEAANAWARDGWLEISTKPGKRLFVTCEGRAAIGDAEDPKEEYELAFESAESPFWEDKAETVFSMSGASASQSVRVPGTADAVFDASVTPSEGTLNTLTLRMGDTYFYFSGLGVAAGTALVLNHDGYGNLRIMAGSSSKYACRLGASDDELRAGPGAVTAGFAANVSCGVAFRCHARYR